MAKRILVLLLGLLFLSGCTEATSETDLLTEISPFSSKSTSPFRQRNPGGYFILTGYCLPEVTALYFRLDELPQWTLIPTTPPSPNAAEGEYLTGSLTYDADCSDGQFNIYMFESQVMSNYTDNGLPMGDPYQVEIRAEPQGDLPTIVFERPAPYTFIMYPQDSENQGYLETGRSTQVYISLRDVYGEETRPLGTDIVVSLLAVNLANSGGEAGSFYASDCTTPITSITFSSASGDREKYFCYIADAVTAFDQILIEASASGMISQSFNLTILNQHTATLQLRPFVGTGSLPPHLVKGVDYRFNLQMTSLYQEPQPSATSRYVYDFNGVFSVTTSNDVYLRAGASDTNCNTSFQTGSLLCSVGTSTSKELVVKVDASSSQSSITLNALNDDIADCHLQATKCRIYESPTAVYYNIPYYAPLAVTLDVVSGSTTYSQPYFKASTYNYDEQMIRINECYSGFIAAGNAQGHLLPSPASGLTMTISSEDANVTFYSSETDCNSGGTGATSRGITLPADSLGTNFFYTVDSIPADGKVQFTIDESSSTWTHEFYLEGSDGGGA